ncbi:MAG: 2,3-diphosphoglycerate-dependent phosphoglycerate mutase [Gammaproteobacteria bacterium]|nr:2,3-diphosphoglycerate-dependent phosphoglycerate mutase [Gammaproteobacteria bacterium]
MPNEMFMPVVVMIRHAQSEWNREGRFTGWADPGLTEVGEAEAVRAGQLLARRGLHFDAAYTSRLARARQTAETVLRLSGDADVPLVADWRLNERHYGALQGEDKAAMTARVGEHQVWRWRRGYLDRPPAMTADDPHHPARDARMADIDPAERPNGESLADTRRRVTGFWDTEIVPQIRAGRRLLIASHGNTLRALIMALDGMQQDQVEAFEIPTGVPILYVFSASGEPIGWHYLDPTADGLRAA